MSSEIIAAVLADLISDKVFKGDYLCVSKGSFYFLRSKMNVNARGRLAELKKIRYFRNQIIGIDLWERISSQPEMQDVLAFCETFPNLNTVQLHIDWNMAISVSFSKTKFKIHLKDPPSNLTFPGNVQVTSGNLLQIQSIFSLNLADTEINLSTFQWIRSNCAAKYIFLSTRDIELVRDLALSEGYCMKLRSNRGLLASIALFGQERKVTFKYLPFLGAFEKLIESMVFSEIRVQATEIVCQYLLRKKYRLAGGNSGEAVFTRFPRYVPRIIYISKLQKFYHHTLLGEIFTFNDQEQIHVSVFCERSNGNHPNIVKRQYKYLSDRE